MLKFAQAKTLKGTLPCVMPASSGMKQLDKSFPEKKVKLKPSCTQSIQKEIPLWQWTNEEEVSISIER